MTDPKREISDLVSVKESAKILGIKLRRTYRLIHRSPALPIQRRGRRLYLYRRDLESFMGREGTAVTPSQDTDQNRGVDDLQVPVPPRYSDGTTSATPPPQLGAARREGTNGQRELRLPQRYWTPVVVFAGLEILQ